MQKNKTPPGLTITFGDERRKLTVNTVRVALQNALEMLQSYESDFVSGDTHVRWEIARISMQSPLTITFEPKILGTKGKSIARRMMTALDKDIRTIEKKTGTPKHFHEDGLVATQKLMALAKKEEAPIKMGKDKRSQIALTDHSTKRIQEIVAKVRRYADFSTIDGKLLEVSMHDGLSFAVWDVLSQRRIQCVVTTDQFNQWQGLIGKRVAVTGSVSYSNHIPRKIVVEEIRTLRDAGLLPQPKDIGPINITDGMASEEYLRVLRNA